MNKRIHLLLLLAWIIIGSCLRFIGLEKLPPWTDECATIVFSLGNTFRHVPLNQIINADVLLQPLQVISNTEISDVTERLFSESTHPPIYFIINHLWMKIFSPPGELASIFAARSLSAILGIISIPAMFGFGYIVFRSALVGHIAAALMAVSPYNIFLAREARHYTLVILLLIASLSCFMKAIEVTRNHRRLPIWVGLTWVIVNALGIATHFFFSLALCVQGCVLLLYIAKQIKSNKWVSIRLNWLRMLGVAFGTFSASIVWLPILTKIRGNELTTWVSDGSPHFIEPIWRLFLWMISIFVLPPSAISIVPIWIVVISGVFTLLFLGWVIYNIRCTLQAQQLNSTSAVISNSLKEYIIGAIFLFLSFSYFLGIDLTLAPRFQFIYTPTVILVFAAALAICWQEGKNFHSQNHQFFSAINKRVLVGIIAFMSLLGGVTVVGNIGYLQHHRPDILAPTIYKASQSPAIIATSHKHHGQTGRMMGLALEFKRLSGDKFSSNDWQFFLVHKDFQTDSYSEGMEILNKQLTQVPRPLDLWLVNFRTKMDLESQNCFLDPKYNSYAGEYKYKLYRCAANN
ncbi:glycosyltransferase family 39 protein [Mastigocoleus testarum]|uniref:Uncharacterized protein n=1 Tax=Mastigocoleus testarum BC008 TaxID=371196 RepID=A0A0V7ZDH4_9CYAN|nr:glycosyltransferase family 39 protein [Mastigocoleus testarum]KST62523.1 hypothetical protein BC008_10160 [Mastigocoleus testarum BC008]KST69143.1 hypothetical protein BC008_35115 [Mastigocoleus testarum BC008]